jgi:pyruvate-ferredoxin/flavodoxin oxidoreductase
VGQPAGGHARRHPVGASLWVIDAYAVAQDAGMGRRINTIMQTCFFAISGILPRDEAIAAIKKAVDKTYGKKSKRLADLNHRPST